jgi:hypothetical protein
MTTAKRTALATLFAFVGPLLIPLATSGFSAAFALGRTSQQLAGKESSVDHERDLRELQRGFQDSLYALTRRVELRQVHDSAFNAMILQRITEGNCARNPRLAQCSPP